MDLDWIHPYIGLDWIGSAKMDPRPLYDRVVQHGNNNNNINNSATI